MTFGERRTALFFLNGFAKDTILTEVLKRLTYLQPEDLSAHAIHSFLDLYVPAIQVKQESDWNNMMTDVLSGGTALYLDGEAHCCLSMPKSSRTESGGAITREGRSRVA